MVPIVEPEVLMEGDHDINKCYEVTAEVLKECYKELKLHNVNLNGTIELGPFKIEYITLTHSILEPNGLRIETPVGVILHTGDWKVDPNPLIGDKINSERLKKIGEKGISLEKNWNAVYSKKSKKIKEEFSRIINNKLPKDFDKIIEEQKKKLGI